MFFQKSKAVRLCAAAASNPRKTALYDLHVANGGKMVQFAGWSLPVQYNDFGIIDSCLHTRSRCSLFDVSHMGQLTVLGDDRVKFVESMTVGDIDGLNDGESRLSVFTNNTGGIIDDTVITKMPDSVQLVLNAGCVDKDMHHINECLNNFTGNVELSLRTGYSLLALQGPESTSVLQKFVPGLDLSRIPFMSVVESVVGGIKGCAISRCGYTGEDGFEISIPTDSGTREIGEALVADDAVRLAGLGARDTLRIEAGLCLYGTDIDENTSPVEAGLAWTISKRRRAEGGGFPGSDVIMRQLASGVDRKRVGISILSGPPARHDNKLYVSRDSTEQIGVTTSGTFSPTLGKAIAIGYVQTSHAAVGTELFVDVRGKVNPGVITKLPFVKSNYFRVKA